MNPFAQLTSYELRHLVAHLTLAEHPDDVLRVLSLETSDGRNAWFEAKDEGGDIEGYLADLALASDGCQQRGETPVEIRFMLSAASIRSLAGGFAPRLYSTLVEHGLWRPAQALTYARQQWEASRNEYSLKYSLARTLVNLAPYLDATLLPTAVDLAREIESASDRSRPLAALSRRMADEGDPVSAWPLVLEVVEGAMSPEEEAPLVAYVAARVPQQMVLQAVERFVRLKSSPFYRARAPLLAALVPHLPAETRERVAEQALTVAREESPVHVAEVALTFPDEARRDDVMLEALRRARRRRGGGSDALAAIAPLAARVGLRDQALKAAWQAFRLALRRGPGVWHRPGSPRFPGWAVFEVADQLAPQQRREVHLRARREASRTRRSRRGWALAMIVNALESPLRESTAEDVYKLARRSSKPDQAALTVIIALPALPESMRVDALIEVANRGVEQLWDQRSSVPAGVAREAWRSGHGLTDHVMHAVPPADRPRVVAYVVARMRERHDKNSNLYPRQSPVTLAPFAEKSLAEELYEEAIASAEALLTKPGRSPDLASNRRDWIDVIVPNLPASQLRVLPRRLGRIEDTAELAKAMAAYAQVSGPSWHQALAQARAVDDPANRAPALAELAAAAKDASLLAEALDVAESIDKRSSGKVFQELAERACARQDWSGALAVARRAGKRDQLGGFLMDVARKAPLQLAPEIEAFAHSASDQFWSARALLALAERMDGHHSWTVRRAVLDAALSTPTAAGIDTAGVWTGSIAFASLKEGLDEEESTHLARDILTAVASETSVSFAAIVGMAPHLPESLLGQAAEIARGMRAEDAAVALAAIAAVSPLTTRSEMFSEAWELALTAPAHKQAGAFGAMAAKLPDEYGGQLASATLALGPHMARALDKGVAATLAEPQLTRVLQAVRSWADDDETQATALGAIAQRLAVLGRVDESIETVTGLSTAGRDWADSPQQIAAEGLPLVFARLGQWDHAARAAQLVPETNAWNDPVRDRVFRDVATLLSHQDAPAALLAARRITDPLMRARALQAIADDLAVLPPNQLRAPWSDALRDLARGTRPALLLALIALKPVVMALSPDAGEETAGAVHDVARWWP